MAKIKASEVQVGDKIELGHHQKAVIIDEIGSTGAFRGSVILFAEGEQDGTSVSRDAELELIARATKVTHNAS